MHKRIVILGSTGSIGCAALEVAAALGRDLRIVGLAGGQGWSKLAQQATRFKPATVAIADHSRVDDLRRSCPAGTRVLGGASGLVELVETCEADFVLAAIVGAAGLPATLAAVQRGLNLGRFAVLPLAMIVHLVFLQLEMQVQAEALGVVEDNLPLVQLRDVVMQLVEARGVPVASAVK